MGGAQQHDPAGTSQPRARGGINATLTFILSKFVGDPKAGKTTLAKALLAEPWKVITKMYVPHSRSRD